MNDRLYYIECSLNEAMGDTTDGSFKYKDNDWAPIELMDMRGYDEEPSEYRFRVPTIKKDNADKKNTLLELKIDFLNKKSIYLDAWDKYLEMKEESK